MSRDEVLVNDWHVVARSEDLGRDQVLRASLLSEDLVLWRCDGEPRVWQDLCAHRGARLSLGRVQDARLVCPYHGWEYNGFGQCVRIPAHPKQIPPARAKACTYRVCERYGVVWASLGRPEGEPSAIPEWENDRFRGVLCGPYVYQASGVRAVENFLDLAHFPFVHSGMLGDAHQTEMSDYEVEWSADGLIARDIEVWQPYPDPTGQPKYARYTYQVFRPLTAYISKNTGGEDRYCTFMAVTPASEFRSVAWVWVMLNYGADIPAEKIRERTDRVWGQDIPIVESQRPERLPLDLQAELHLRSDRLAVEYRRWLKQLGVNLGTR